MAHTLQLATQDALKLTYFVTIDDDMLHIYCMKKLPKTCSKLEEIAIILKECLEEREWVSGKGLRYYEHLAQGS